MANWCEELTQLILSQSHLSMDKSVAKVNDQLSQKLEPQEVDSPVQTPRRDVQAAGDRLRIHHQRFEEMSIEKNIESLRLCGIHEESLHQRVLQNFSRCGYGFGGTTGTCREYTLPRDDPDSELFASIGGHTRIGPVRNSKSYVVLINTESKYMHPVNIKRRI